ncbi:hypothetical protein F2P56_034607 [Juglans regia]|uniref:Uncharacterized protein n=1 Tax=Juglans regia TaxID=51240 RepID=A0A833SPW9_JUGRE|nr:hypothetical protein F2P56_034607 [Juglans regia]
MTQIQLQQGQPQAPYVTGVAVIVPAVGIRVEPFGAHVGAGADVGVARVQRTAHDLADSKIGDLHLHRVVHQEIRGFEVTVDDLVPMEVVQAVENLARHVGKLGLGESTMGLEQRVEGTQVHVLHENRDVATWLLEYTMAADNVGRVGASEDFHLPKNLSAEGGVRVRVNDLEGVDIMGALVADLVDGATIAMAKDLKLFEVGDGDGRRGGSIGDSIGRKG